MIYHRKRNKMLFVFVLQVFTSKKFIENLLEIFNADNIYITITIIQYIPFSLKYSLSFIII